MGDDPYGNLRPAGQCGVNLVARDFGKLDNPVGQGYRQSKDSHEALLCCVESQKAEQPLGTVDCEKRNGSHAYQSLEFAASLVQSIMQSRSSFPIPLSVLHHFVYFYFSILICFYSSVNK